MREMPTRSARAEGRRTGVRAEGLVRKDLLGNDRAVHLGPEENSSVCGRALVSHLGETRCRHAEMEVLALGRGRY